MEDELELRRARQRAIHRVLGMLRSPIMLMCLPDRVEAERLCAEHAITALDLLNYGRRQAQEA